MNGALLMGLGAGLNAYNSDQQKERDYQRELEMMDKKARLQTDLEMQVQKMKLEYAKANPQYNKFIEGRFGDVIGFDEFGGTKQVYEAPEDVRKSFKDEYDYQRAYKEAQSEAAKARAELSGVNALLAPQKQDSLDAYRQARLDAASERDEDKEESDFELSPVKWAAARKNYMPPVDEFATPEAIAAAQAAAEEAMKADGLTKKTKPEPKAKGGDGLVAPTPKVFPLDDKEYMNSINQKAETLRNRGVPEEEIDAAVQADITAEAAKRGYQL